VVRRRSPASTCLGTFYVDQQPFLVASLTVAPGAGSGLAMETLGAYPVIALSRSNPAGASSTLPGAARGRGAIVPICWT